MCVDVCVVGESGHKAVITNEHRTPPTQTASQPIENLLLPQDFVAANANTAGAGADAKGPGSLEAAHADGDEEDAKFYESVLPDGWDVGADGKFVDVTTGEAETERPTRSTGWTPWRLF